MQLLQLFRRKAAPFVLIGIPRQCSELNVPGAPNLDGAQLQDFKSAAKTEKPTFPVYSHGKSFAHSMPVWGPDFFPGRRPDTRREASIAEFPACTE